ncbi:hypothetical protein RQP46_007546 [Phenoliferia psychrophenolica]
MPSSATLYVGVDHNALDLKRAPVVHYSTLKKGETLPAGSLIQRWDFVAPVGPSALWPEEQQPWRLVADPEADEVVEILKLGPGVDALEAIKKEATLDGNAKVTAFWNAMSAGPKSESEVVDHPLIREGQDVFWRYSNHMFLALMYFSLVGGFAAPNLAGVLRETGYMTSASKEATYKRLLETTMFVTDVMSDMAPGSRGWKATIRVRMLHAQVRRKIRMGKGKFNEYPESGGLPINQCDLAVVLCAFMVGPTWALQRMGIHLSKRESDAYQAVWRHVGFYLGIDHRLLDRICAPTFAGTEVAFASLLFAVFPRSRPPRPQPSTSTSTYSLLAAIVGREPKPHLKIGFHCEMARLLLGPILADQLALPSGTMLDRLVVHKEIALARMFVEFGKWWRSGWEKERISLTGELVNSLIVTGLGQRRSVFSWREEKDWANALKSSESEAPDVKGSAAFWGEAVRWNVLIAELVLVLLCAAVGLMLTARKLYAFLI